ncbi:hypothetical protein ACFFIO_07115 [Citricoccus parietis]|uniref:Uncharacterized protein n=1 Tax=Citricoccus parietis TaxID=592307 RepID=A0ABV6F422_9MICC
MELKTEGASRCKARRTNGEPCRNYPIKGATVCRKHGGGAPQVRKKAAERIAEAADNAAELLVLFMQDSKNDIKVRVQIAQDLLNRAGYAGKNAVDLKVSVFDQAVSSGEFLVDLGETDERPAVEEAPPAPTPSPVRLRKRRR